MNKQTILDTKNNYIIKQVPGGLLTTLNITVLIHSVISIENNQPSPLETVDNLNMTINKLKTFIQS